MKYQMWLLSGLACLFGVLISIRDVLAVGDDAPMLTLLQLVIIAALLGFIRPGRAWRWALLIGIWPALVHLIARAGGIGDHFSPDTTLARLALAPVALATTLGGAYGGVAARRILMPSVGSPS